MTKVLICCHSFQHQLIQLYCIGLCSSSADHQSSATCDVSESSVEGNLSAMALGMSNSDDGLSEDTRSSSVAGKEEIELTLTNSVGEITLISYSSSSPTTHDHGRVSKSMGAAPLSSLFSVSVHAPLVTGLLDSDTFQVKIQIGVVHLRSLQTILFPYRENLWEIHIHQYPHLPIMT